MCVCLRDVKFLYIFLLCDVLHSDHVSSSFRLRHKQAFKVRQLLDLTNLKFEHLDMSSSIETNTHKKEPFCNCEHETIELFVQSFFSDKSPYWTKPIV